VLFTGNIFTPTAYAESSSSYIHWIELLDTNSSLYLIGEVLINHYFLYIISSGLLLLPATIGAVSLTCRFDERDIKIFNSYRIASIETYGIYPSEVKIVAIQYAS
jgi:hypothetical protein